MNKEQTSISSLFSTTGHEDEYTARWMEQQKETKDENIEIGEINLFVSHDVFSPKTENTNSVNLLLHNFPEVENKKVLDVGTGTGILAIKAALEGARLVVATDVTEASLENAKKNVELTNTGGIVKVIDQEKFEDLDEVFDVIIMNIIFAHSPEDSETKEKARIESLGIHQRLIDSLPKLLSPDGKVVLGFASFGDIDRLSKILINSSLEVDVIKENKFGVEWYVINLKKRV